MDGVDDVGFQETAGSVLRSLAAVVVKIGEVVAVCIVLALVHEFRLGAAECVLGVLLALVTMLGVF